MPKYRFTEAECEKWRLKKNVNPRTKRPINPDSKRGIYQELKEQCAQFKKTSKSAKPDALPLVKKPGRIWKNLSRDQVIQLASDVLEGKPKAVEKALKIHKTYCQNKDNYNDLFNEWRRTGKLEADRDLELAAEFLGRFCRCILEIKATQVKEREKILAQIDKTSDQSLKKELQNELNKLSGIAYGSCQKSIYNNRGLKGVATRGDDKVQCDDALAEAQIVLKKVAKC